MFSPSKFARLAVVALPLVGAAAAFSGTARANVRSVNNGSVCQWEEPEDRRGFEMVFGTPTTIGHHFWSRYNPLRGINHTDETDGTRLPLSHPVACNIPRNLPLSTAGLSDLEVRFRTVGPFGGLRTASCTVWSLRGDGTIAAAATRSVQVDGNNLDTSVVMDFNNAISSSGSKGSYTMTCSLPQYVGLMSIYSSEVDGVDAN